MRRTDQTKPSISGDAAGEIDEAQLAEVTGGASDYLLVIDGVKGESRSTAPSGGANAALGDGSVRFLR